MLRFFRKYHKWPSLFFSLFILLFAISGIILNHRELFSSVDLNRKWLSQNYFYKNWNLASVKGSAEISPDSLLVYDPVKHSVCLPEREKSIVFSDPCSAG